MEFRGIVCAPISLTRAVPWNSMEIGVRNSMKPLLSSKIYILMLRGFYWSTPISLNLGCAHVASMEFHQIQCPNFDVTTSSMEFHGSPWNLVCANFADTCSYMECHGTWSAPISMTRAVPWKSMNTLLSSKLEMLMLHRFYWTWSMYNTHILWLMIMTMTKKKWQWKHIYCHELHHTMCTSSITDHQFFHE